jgi:hypothetical protein
VIFSRSRCSKRLERISSRASAESAKMSQQKPLLIHIKPSECVLITRNACAIILVAPPADLLLGGGGNRNISIVRQWCYYNFKCWIISRIAIRRLVSQSIPFFMAKRAEREYKGSRSARAPAFKAKAISGQFDGWAHKMYFFF